MRSGEGAKNKGTVGIAPKFGNMSYEITTMPTLQELDGLAQRQPHSSVVGWGERAIAQTMDVVGMQIPPME